MYQVLRLILRFKYPLLLFFLCLLFLQRIIFHPQNPVLSGDIFGIFLLEKNFLVDSLKQFHQLPLWNPYSFSGVPFVATSTPAVFFPINILFFILPVKIAFGYVFSLDALLSGIFTYLFARKIKLSQFSSFFAGFCFMFSSVMISKILAGHIYMDDAIAWFPLFLFFIESYIQDSKLIFSMLAGLCIGMMFLAGNGQVALYSILAGGIYSLLRGGVVKTIRAFSLAVLFGLTVSAIQVIPTSEFSKLSIRQGGIIFKAASDFSLHPAQILMFLFPSIFGTPVDQTYWGRGYFHETSGYAGVLVVFFAMFSLFQKTKKRYVFIFLSLFVFSLLFCFGRYTPFFYILYSLVPGVSLLRVPARFIFVATFSLCILASLGLELFFIKKTNFKKINLLTLVWIALSIFGIVSLIPATKGLPFIFLYKKFFLANPHSDFVSKAGLTKGFEENVLVFSIAIFTSGILVLLKSKNKVSENIFKIGIISIAVLDLWFFSTKIIMTAAKPVVLAQSTKIVNLIQTDEDHPRVFDLSGSLFPQLEQENIQQTMGIHSMQIRNYKEFLWLAGTHHEDISESFFEFDSIRNLSPINLLNSKYIVSSSKLKLPSLAQVENEEILQNDYYLYENKDVLPKAFTVSHVDFVINDKNSFAKISSSKFNPKDVAIVNSNVEFSENFLQDFKPAKQVYSSPNKIIFEISVDAPSFLVISMPYFPGWVAYDNGEKTKVYKTDYALSGIEIKKGNNKIEYIYDPMSLKIGAIVSVIGIINLIFVVRKSLLPRSINSKKRRSIGKNRVNK